MSNLGQRRGSGLQTFRKKYKSAVTPAVISKLNKIIIISGAQPETHRHGMSRNRNKEIISLAPKINRASIV